MEWNADVGFELLLAHFRKGEEGRRVMLVYDREHLIQALSSRDRPRLVRLLLETAVAGPEKGRIAMELRDLLRPELDIPVLLQCVEQYGLEAARLVAKHLDADQPEFWDMIPSFIAQWGDDVEVRGGLVHSMTWVHGISRDRKGALESRREPLERLCAHPDPLVRELARQAKEALHQEIKIVADQTNLREL